MTTDGSDEGGEMDTPVSVEEAAKFLGGLVSVKTLYRWAAEGRIPSLKLGGKRCFLKRQLAAWLAQHQTGAAQ